VENRVVIGDLDDLAVGEDAAHAVGEDLPLLCAVEVVAHEEAAAEEVFAEGGHLFVGEGPVADLDSVEPGPIVLVAIVEIDGLLDGADVDAREAADGLRGVAAERG
jgi:hypothetical protein